LEKAEKLPQFTPPLASGGWVLCLQIPNQILLLSVTTFQCAGPALTRLI